MPLRRREFLAAMGGAALSGHVASRPNIVLILADDLGIGDLGCYGQTRIATPNLDRLAAEGIRFTDAYAGGAVCAPSRCCLMTGLHTGHARIRDNHNHRGERVSLRPDDVTVAEVLKTAGYHTALIGKWGLGEAGTRGTPNQQGFDEFYGMLNNDHASEFYPRHIWENESEIILEGNQGTGRKHFIQDLLTRRALDFLARAADRPFFLFLAYTMPHADSALARQTGDGFPVPDYGPYADRPWPVPEKGFAAAVHFLDRDVGRVLDRIRELGIAESTLVIFTSDNGPANLPGHSPAFFRSAGPYRGHKGQLYEGGLRIPLIARWPGKIPAGRVSCEVWAFWDFLPLAAELAEVQPPPGRDGISPLAALLGRERKPQPEFLYWEAPSGGFWQAVRSGRWKAIRQNRPQRPLELYDLESDPGERRDVAARRPDIVRRMERLLRDARTDSPDYPISASPQSSGEPA